MPAVQLSINGALSSVTVDSLDVPLSALKALAPAAAPCALLIGGLPFPDDATLAAAKYDGASTIYAVRAGVKLAEVAQHKSKESIWMVMHAPTITHQPAPAGEQSAHVVYDMTSYLDDHPGGPGTMLAAAGAYAACPLPLLLLPAAACCCCPRAHLSALLLTYTPTSGLWLRSQGRRN